jgi:hypothetical protein
MKFRRISAPLLFLPLLVVMALAGDQKPAASSKPPRISKQTRMELVKLVNAELVYVRSPFPMGRDGLKLKDGVVTPSGAELQQLMAVWGPAAKNGDAARITDVVFKDNFIHVEINGGPIRKQKWYQRISVGGSGGSVPISPSDPNANARGSFVNVYFDDYIPEMTGRDFKELLRPVLDFDSKSPEEAYLETVPPKVKEAIQNHRVLVGMDRDMVTFAKGRPPKKIREHQDEAEYEEWIYGEPPQDVEFVRFMGDEVSPGSHEGGRAKNCKDRERGGHRAGHQSREAGRGSASCDRTHFAASRGREGQRRSKGIRSAIVDTACGAGTATGTGAGVRTELT